MDNVQRAPACAGAISTSKLKYGVSALALGAMLVAAPAMAQTKPASDVETVEEVVVTSIRQSLKSSQQLKQSSDIISDSITAEDIGALPDRSVTEALQRIPGVAINRFAAGVDPDHFSTEGSGVVVRGLNFVRSELNGRDTFSANNGRALSFADVPAELMGGVDVFKSPSADMIEGGISGTVNLRTRLPFDSTKRLLSLSAEASYGDFVKKWAPTFSALYSDQWDTEAGTFGLLLSAVDSKLWTRSDGTQVSNFGCRTNFTAAQTANPQAVDCPNNTGKGVWFPRGAAFRSTETERDRTGYAAAGQWRSNDDTMLATLQYLRSESTQSWTEHAMEIATDNVTSNGDSRPIDGTTFGVDSDGIFTNGIITGSQGWRDDQNGSNPRTPANGLQSNNITRSVEQKYLTSDYGFNFKWTPNETWGVALDVQHVDSSVDNLDVGVWASTFQNLDLKLNGSDMPVFTFIPPASGAAPSNCTPFNSSCSSYYRGGHNNFQDPYNSFWRSAMDHIEQSEGKEDAVKLDVDYRFAENSWLDSARVGVRWSERDQTTRFTSYNWGVLSEIWGGGGPVWFDEPINSNPATAGGSSSAAFTELYPFTDFMRGEVPAPTGLEARPFYKGNPAQDYAAMSATALAIGDEWRARLSGSCPQNWVPLAQRCGVTAGTPFRPAEINPVNEQTQSAYGMLRFKHDFEGDVRVTGNFGLRYTKTKREASGFLAYPSPTATNPQSCATSLANWQALPDPKPPFVPSDYCQLPVSVQQAAVAFSNGATVPNTAHISYDYWLPSLNVKVALPNKVQLRFGASKTITPPDIGLTRNYYNIALDTTDAGIAGPPVTADSLTGTVTVGNPLLKPTQSINFDGSAEWYFAPVGSLTFALFWKELKDVATNTTERVPFTNNGATFNVAVTTPGNSDVKAHVKGFEVAYQQFYDFLPAPFDGFGINANYSYIDSKGVPQSTLSATDPDVAAGRVSTVNTGLLPLQGLSKHNANLAAIYEKGAISARLAYNWRSDFLLTVRDVIVPYAPIMNEATGQLDGSIFYTINDKVKVGVQGVNLTNEITKTTQVLNDQLLKAGRSWFMNDRRYTFVLRASF
ncbi:TonB-dependent receptor [Caulobacter sp. Root1455]|uniref:TonB-dependent receptor n=1 Tax=unclassified Caulobacter TaxID=2648921 RepID=UPI0006F35979|nr:MULTISPECIES: TonB-dependent receptor [unclassified Caulobacter]KQY26482.1 TonB-dependent receptor [Caulobacter sp. Root487D2Y]KQY91459.1 TonB-dependent receptor [Caulobacter sp. Root1455]